MGVVVAQSKATANVYRVFAAMVALLVVMAVAVTVSRLRSDSLTGSPYGALTALTQPSASPASVPLPASVAPPAAVAAVNPAPAPAPASRAAAVEPGQPTQTMAAAVVPPPAPVTPADPVRVEPRTIALDRSAAGSAIPQPAPPARVEAAVRASAAAAPAKPLAAPAASPVQEAAADQPPAKSSTGAININTASLDQLNSIPGGGHIGRTIMQHRPYRSLDDLVEHRVLKARDFARIRSAISVD